MNVLITGGAGFIGSKVATILYKEGHKIFIIDNLSSGRLSNVSVAHHFYNLNIEDKKCEEIFSSSNIEIVIHLAGHNDFSRKKGDPFFEAKDNLAGFLNILKIANTSNVKKFVNVTYFSKFELACSDEYKMLSEDERYEKLRHSPLTITDMVEEMYGELWSQMNDTQALSLRVSNVYGPQDIYTNEKSKISEIIEEALDTKIIKLRHYKDFADDYIYIDDVAYAVQRACEFFDSPSINITSAKRTTLEQVLEVIQAIDPTVVIDKKGYIPDKVCSDDKYIRSENKALDELGWTPFISIKDGIRRTYDWTKEKRVKDEDKKERFSLIKQIMNHNIVQYLLPYLENGLAFLLVTIIIASMTLYNIDFGIDFRLVYIITIAMVYGLKQSSIAILLATVHYVFSIYYVNADVLSLIYNIDTLLTFSIYLFIGSVIGYTVDTHKQEVFEKEEELKILLDKYDFIAEMYDESKSVKEKLQDQILNSQDSFSKIYSVTNKLESLEPGVIYSKLISIIEEVVKVSKVCLFSVGKDQGYLRMLSSSEDFDIDIPKSLPADYNDELLRIIEERELFVNMEMNKDLPMIILPISNDGVVIALIFIYGIKFNELTNYKKIMLKAIGDIIAVSVIRAKKYQEAIEHKRYMPGTKILKPSIFNEILVSKLKENREVNESVTFLKLAEFENNSSSNIIKVKDISVQIESTIREFDYMGLDSNENLFLVLSNTTEEEAIYAMKRLTAKGAAFVIISEEDIYGDNSDYSYTPESDIAN